RLTSCTQERELARERRRERLAPRLAALASAHEQRGPPALEIEVGPVERDQLCTAKAGLDEREEHEPVALGERDRPGSGAGSQRRRGGARTLSRSASRLPVAASAGLRARRMGREGRCAG